MKENIIKDKSFAFAVRIVNLYKFLIDTKKEYVLSKQLLKSGTSIGANIEEAIGGQSKSDFISKISISYKEARESHYWLRILRETDYISDKQFISIEKDLNEILKIITSIQKTSKKISN
ncbi:MAG: four helix bundle protein [Bacteroidota bacterium]